MVPYVDYVYYTELALAAHAIIFWHVYPTGDYIPLMLPVDDVTWRLLVQ